MLANHQDIHNVIFTENSAKAKEHSSTLGVLNFGTIP